MKDKFIVVSLYVDDKKNLPVEEQFVYKTKDGNQKEIVTYGDLWASFETENFANNAQPLYAVLNNNQELLSHPVGYTPDKQTYLDWLKANLLMFEKEK
jgi:thiol:disulfide interchange protein DsbD